MQLSLLKNIFNLPVGFSDHTIGFHIPIAAIAKGATVIEKHFTIDKSLPGPDQKLSTDPEEFEKIIKYGNEVFQALREKGKVINSQEIEMRKNARRSIVAARDLDKDKVLTYEDLDYKRPGDGVSPTNFKFFTGKTLVNSKKKDEKIMWCDIE